MSETTTQNETTTLRPSNIRYEKRQAMPVRPAGLEGEIGSSCVADENVGDYVRAYRTDGQSIGVSYNAAEIHARAVRRELSKILGG